MATRTLQLSDAIHQYILQSTMKEADVLRRLREETMQMPSAECQISPEQGQFMRLLAEMLGVRRAVEVGVYTGYSSLCVAQALPKDGRLVACDVNEEWTGIAKRYWAEAGVAEKIQLYLAPAAETLQGLLIAGGGGQYDFAFIDADKPAYDTYYEFCLKLLRPGGVIALDNMLWAGKVADVENNDTETVAIRALNAKIAADPRVSSCMVPIGDGVHLVRKK